MEYKDKRNFLKGYAESKNNLGGMKERYEAQLTKVQRMTSNPNNYNGFNMFTGHSKVEKGAMKLIELEKEYKANLVKMETIEKELYKLKYRPRMLVMLVDINGWKISEAAKYLHMDYKNAYLMYRRAIDKLMSDDTTSE